MADLYILDDKSLRAQIFDSINAIYSVSPTACTCQIGCEDIESCTVVNQGACGESCTTAVECSQCRCQSGCLSCNTTCQQNCENCEGKCAGNCQSTCESDCQDWCERVCENCEGSCSGTCQTTCELDCQSCDTCQSCNTCECSGQNNQCTCNNQGCQDCQEQCQLYCESGCQTSCQKCNSCQSKCEKGNQALTTNVGTINTKSKQFTRTATANYTSLAEYINKALDACAYTDAKLDVSVSLKDVLMDDSLFDKVKIYVNKIANTTLSTGISGDSKIAANDMSKIENALNSSTIPNTIPCCEDSNNQNCINIQSGCIRRQDS